MADIPRLALMVPGLGGSGPAHWQAIWAASRRDCLLLRQASWDDPARDDWTDRLDRAVAASALPVVVVAHSLGCAALAHWAAAGGGTGVVAAMLVAPCDVDAPTVCDAIARFRPMPAAALPFRSTVVASRNDPYAEFARSRCFAERWGSAFVDVGFAGHINADSGLGAWDFGQVPLDELMTSVADERHVRAAGLRSATRLPAPCFGP